MANPVVNKTLEGRTRASEPRDGHAPRRIEVLSDANVPAAGAHAAAHLVNEDATPGAGALPSYAHAGGKEVDGGAG